MKRIVQWMAGLLLALVIGVGCKSSGPGQLGDSCELDTDCAGSLFCVRSACRVDRCSEENRCPAGWGCVDGVCCSDERCCGTEGPMGNPDCSNQLDDDCDGTTDDQDEGCQKCEKNSDCDDGHPCTEETCTEAGSCEFAPHPNCCQGDGTFVVGSTITVEGGPTTLTTGDFNGDGLLDLAVTLKNSGQVAIFINQPKNGIASGKFGEAKTVAAGDSPWVIVPADLNGDQYLDLAVTNQNTASISVLLRDGASVADAVFLTPVPYSVGSLPRGIAIGDFSGDGALDLAVANFGGEQVSILLGNAAQKGTFAPAVDYVVKPAPRWLVAEDLTKDGILDIAVVDVFLEAGNLSILAGNGASGKGDGTFRGVNDLSLRADPVFITAAKLNQDDLADVAIVFQQTEKIGVFLSGGDGSFGLQVELDTGTGSQPSALTIGQFNADLIPDLAVSLAGRNEVAIYLGKENTVDGGLSTFTYELGETYSVGTQPQSVVAQDFNQDGIKDLAVANPGSNAISLLVGKGVCCMKSEDPSELTCNDNLDNDCDQKTDCTDEDCAAKPPCGE